MTRSARPSRRPARRRRTSAVLVTALLGIGVVVAWQASGPLLGAVGLDLRAVGGPAPTQDGGPDGGGVPGADAPTPATGLDAELQRRFEAAQAAAAADDVSLTLTSGWRSAADQQALLDDAVERYGSLEEALRWVLPPEESAHVQGLAIDVGDTEGAYWLAEHSLDFGLCQTYANEIWHFEKLPDGATSCPEPSQDPSGG